jgi:hypothetical protein
MGIESFEKKKAGEALNDNGLAAIRLPPAHVIQRAAGAL